ncbi:MAG: hypothetical protein ACRDO7_16220 [Nocardioidaceae bacterium]
MTTHPAQHPRAYDWVGVGRRDDGWVEFTVGGAFAYAWVRFWTNAPTWVLFVVASVAISLTTQFLVGGFDLDGVQGFVWSGGYSPAAIGGWLVTTVVHALLAAVLTRAALDEVHGRKASVRAALRLGDPRAVLLGCVLLAAGYAVGTLLLVLPGLVFAFLASYTLTYVLDREQDAVTALRSSVSFVAANVGRFLMLAVAVVAVNLAGALLFGVGLLLTVPVTMIASMHAFRTLQGERVS